MEQKSEGAELEQWENKMRKSHRLSLEGAEGGRGEGGEGSGRRENEKQ